MRITIEIDGTTFTAQPVQGDARASGASMTANTAAATAAAGTGGAETDLFARAAALGALDGGPAPPSMEQGVQRAPQRRVGASAAESADEAISAGPAPAAL